MTPIILALGATHRAVFLDDVKSLSLFALALGFAVLWDVCFFGALTDIAKKGR